MEDRKIPTEFYNSETDQPFETCLICNKNVLNSNEPYYVERIFRKVDEFDIIEPLFEYAMCGDCAEEMRKRMSVESMQNIENYFRQKLNDQPTIIEANVSDQMKHCLFTGKNISDCKEFSFHAQFIGDQISQSIFPYAVSDDAMDEVAMLLSAETADELDDFKGKYFSGPPEIAKLINPRRLVPF